MNMSKRVAVILSGLVLAGAAALAMTAAAPAGAGIKTAYPCSGGNGGGGGGGGGTTFYNPNQNYNPFYFVEN